MIQHPADSVGHATTNILFLGGTQTQPATPAGTWLIGLVGLLIVVITPWILARVLLRTRDVFNIRDRALSRLQFGRSFFGLVIAVMVGIRYSGKSKTYINLCIHWNQTLLIGGLCLVGCTMLLLAVNQSRGELLRSSVRPFLRVLLIVAIWRLIPLLGRWPRVNKILATNPDVKIPSIPDVLLVLASGWLVFLTLACMYYAIRYLYGADEMHPYLGPAVAMTTVTVFVIIGVLHGAANTPRSIYFGTTVGGWLLATFLSVKEWQSIKGRCEGLTIRNVPVKGFGSFPPQQAHCGGMQ
jgi:hypothetical protein